MDEDYYAILGVGVDADAATVRKAYKKEALKWHPDKNPNNQEEASRMFQKIGRAYECLSDVDKRRSYDQARRSGRSSSSSRSEFHGAHYSRHPSEAEEMLRRMHQEQYFWEQMQQQYFEFQEHMRPADQCLPLKLSLEALYSGCTKRLRHTRKVFDSFGNVVSTHVMKDKVTIPPGLREGSKVRCQGWGDSMPGSPTGDVVFEVKMKRHSRFTRNRDDLVAKRQVTLREAMLGLKFTVLGLDNKHIIVDCLDTVIKPGMHKRIKGRGMPKKTAFGKAFGDLIVEFSVVFPDTLSETAKKALAEVDF